MKRTMNRRMGRTATLAAAAVGLSLGLASVTALAGDRMPPHPMGGGMGAGMGFGMMDYSKAEFDARTNEQFKKFDANGDGTITKAEFKAVHDKLFADMDVNKDGKLSREDRKARRDQMRGDMPCRDTDGAGKGAPTK